MNRQDDKIGGGPQITGCKILISVYLILRLFLHKLCNDLYLVFRIYGIKYHFV